MRLIGEFQSGKQASGFQIFLQNHGIQSVYDATCKVWIIEEDDFDKAVNYYEQWQKDPLPQDTPEPSLPPPEHAHWKVRMAPPRLQTPFSLNNILILICGFLFIWTLFQMDNLGKQQGPIALKYELVPLQKKLMFDNPAYLAKVEKFLQKNDIKTEEDFKSLSPKAQARFMEIEKTPTWNGVAEMIAERDWDLLEKLPKGALFEKIRQGEVWRLFTPVLLHGNLLHVLFNMAWLYVLGRQIEERIGKIRYLFLSLLLGVAGNVAQYLVSGPLFLGYSGIITGMVGFIWMRQKIAPWEGYPLQRPVILFITVFVFAMLALEIVSMTLQFFHIQVFPTVANTAHIIGGFFGILLGRLPLFERGRP